MKYLFFDTETTNLIHNSLQPLEKQPRIIELFAMVLDGEAGWKELGSIHEYIHPGISISEEVTRITGITNERVANKPRFEVVAGRVAEFFKQAEAVVAHNLSYDMTVMDFEFQRLGQKFDWPDIRTCTVEATEWMKGYRLSLTNLHTELFGKAFEGAHGAEADVRATARCFMELMERGEL